MTVQPAYLNEGGGGVAHQLLTGSLRRHTSASFSRIVVSAPYLPYKPAIFNGVSPSSQLSKSILCFSKLTMDLVSASELVTYFLVIWNSLIMGTLVWRHFVTTRRTAVPIGQVSTVETIHARLAVEAAAVVRARQRRH